MTVKELISLLETKPKDAKVFIGKFTEDDFGNYDYNEYELEKGDIRAFPYIDDDEELVSGICIN